MKCALQKFGWVLHAPTASLLPASPSLRECVAFVAIHNLAKIRFNNGILTSKIPHYRLPRKFFKFSRNDAVADALVFRHCEIPLVESWQSIIKQKVNQAMESLRQCNIIDCHENFSNFLAMTQSKPPRLCVLPLYPCKRSEAIHNPKPCLKLCIHIFAIPKIP